MDFNKFRQIWGIPIIIYFTIISIVVFAVSTIRSKYNLTKDAFNILETGMNLFFVATSLIFLKVICYRYKKYASTEIGKKVKIAISILIAIFVFSVFIFIFRIIIFQKSI